MKVVAFVTRGSRKIKIKTYSRFRFFKSKNALRRFDGNAHECDQPQNLIAPKAIRPGSTHILKQIPCFKFHSVSLCSLHQRRAKLETLQGCIVLTESAPWDAQERTSGDRSLGLNSPDFGEVPGLSSSICNTINCRKLRHVGF